MQLRYSLAWLGNGVVILIFFTCKGVWLSVSDAFILFVFCRAFGGLIRLVFLDSGGIAGFCFRGLWACCGACRRFSVVFAVVVLRVVAEVYMYNLVI